MADTNVILRGIRSRSGASAYVLNGMLAGEIAFAASPAVILEYEDVLKRPGVMGNPPVVDNDEIDVIIDVLCLRAVETQPQFRFRPFLDDPKDDLFIECALAANASTIVTDDTHFRHPSVAGFGLRAISAKDYVRELRNERRLK